MRCALGLALVLVSGCRCGPVIEKPDAGVDAGGEGEGEGAGEGEGEGTGPDGGPSCGPSTPTFGDKCGDCGTNICNPLTEQIVCNDPGFNACGACGTLDESAGRVNQPCGVELCGTGQCNSAGTASECIGGEVLRNICGGCQPLDPPDAGPGDTCSTCGTGSLTCTSDQEHFICAHGRAPDNQCGGCNRCVLFHAAMADHVAGGGYLNPGTTAVIEDIGTNNDVGGSSNVKLSFDPLIEGPGACCIPIGAVFLSAQQNPFTGSSVQLTPLFSETATPPPVLDDPVRYFDIPPSVDPNVFRFVVLVDESGLFQDPVLSVGELVAGP